MQVRTPLITASHTTGMHIDPWTKKLRNGQSALTTCFSLPQNTQRFWNKNQSLSHTLKSLLLKWHTHVTHNIHIELLISSLSSNSLTLDWLLSLQATQSYYVTKKSWSTFEECRQGRPPSSIRAKETEWQFIAYIVQGETSPS